MCRIGVGGTKYGHDNEEPSGWARVVGLGLTRTLLVPSNRGIWSQIKGI